MVQYPAIGNDSWVPSLSPHYRKHKALLALGKAVQRLRRARGLSQEGLALLAEIDRSYVGGIERGESNPTLLRMSRIAVALKIRVADLMREARL